MTVATCICLSYFSTQAGVPTPTPLNSFTLHNNLFIGLSVAASLHLFKPNNLNFALAGYILGLFFI